MIDRQTSASNKISSLRLLRKFFLNIAQSKWIPTSYRAKFLSYGGVNMGKNIFIGESIIIDTIRPDLLTIGDNTLLTARCMILTHFYKERWRFLLWRCKYRKRLFHRYEYNNSKFRNNWR